MEDKFCKDCNDNKPVEDFFKSSKDRYQSYCKKHSIARGCKWARQNNAELREKVFEKLGHVCCRCGFSDKRALQIDHVNGGGHKERKGQPRGRTFLKKVLADESGQFQILCANCNWIKKAERHESKPIIHRV